MKKIFVLLFGFLIIYSCGSNSTKEFLYLSGKIENSKDSILSISDRQGVVKKITLNKDGSFKDTLKVDKAAIYTFENGYNKRAPIYLKNGFKININSNADNFLESLKFSGEGASNSSFVLAQIEQSQNIGNPNTILALDEKDFKLKLSKIKSDYDSLLNSYTDLDSTLYTLIKNQNKQVVTYFENAYAQNRIMGKGRPSPKFEDYINFKGGKNSLKDYKGKYVYIDVWATWCGPCIQQIPYLKKVEEEFHNKNIEFISVSTDESRRSGGSWEAAENKWRNFVKRKNLGGVQLWSGQDFSFQQAYQINGIPRFILIDPDGNIVDANAPRPSDPRLKSLFTSLGI